MIRVNIPRGDNGIRERLEKILQDHKSFDVTYNSLLVAEGEPLQLPGRE